jgi:hypothetical protein
MCLCTFSLQLFSFLISHFCEINRDFFSTKMACFLFKTSVVSLSYSFCIHIYPLFDVFSPLDVCIFHWMHASASISRFDSTNEKFFSHFFLWTFTLIIMLCIKWHTTSNSRDQWNSLMIVWLKKVGNLAFGLSRKSLSKTSPCMHASDFNSYS